jgi:hypothetical protein
MQQAWNPKRSMVSVCDIVIDYGWPWICIEAVSERLTQKSLAGGTAADFDQVVAKLVEKKVKQLDVTIQHQPKTARGRRTLALDPGTVGRCVSTTSTRPKSSCSPARTMRTAASPSPCRTARLSIRTDSACGFGGTPALLDCRPSGCTTCATPTPPPGWLQL